MKSKGNEPDGAMCWFSSDSGIFLCPPLGGQANCSWYSDDDVFARFDSLGVSFDPAPYNHTRYVKLHIFKKSSKNIN